LVELGGDLLRRAGCKAKPPQLEDRHCEEPWGARNSCSARLFRSLAPRPAPWASPRSKETKERCKDGSHGAVCFDAG
jgi:hypothetical protein